jgi:hypothetical protein
MNGLPSDDAWQGETTPVLSLAELAIGTATATGSAAPPEGVSASILEAPVEIKTAVTSKTAKVGAFTEMPNGLALELFMT